MKISDLEFEAETVKVQVAELLLSGFSDIAPNAWSNMQEAREEVEESFGQGRFSLVALEGQHVLGWVAAMQQYSGQVWELHPLVVRKDSRLSGVGSALVTEIERRVKDTGALTLWLGTDDETGMTSLAGQDLYPQPLKCLGEIRNLKRHPYEFYEKLGFKICGVLPDANGLGKPDIFMAKRLRNMD